MCLCLSAGCVFKPDNCRSRSIWGLLRAASGLFQPSPFTSKGQVNFLASSTIETGGSCVDGSETRFHSEGIIDFDLARFREACNEAGSLLVHVLPKATTGPRKILDS